MAVRTLYHDMREMGNVAKEVNYQVKIPAQVHVRCKNSFGDVLVRGVHGNVTIESQFSAVHLGDVGGTVKVRARGELPLHAYGLRGGGSFELHGTQAELSRVSGTLELRNFFGSVTLRELAPEADVNVSSDSGTVRLYLEESDMPDLEAHVLFGALKCEPDLNPVSTGDLTYARSLNVESKQRIRLDATFGDVEILRPRPVSEPSQRPMEAREYTEGVVEQALDLPEGTQVVVEAITGNVRVVGVDENRLSVKATQVVHMGSQGDPQATMAAIEALDLRVEELAGRATIKGAVRDDLAALGCLYFRMDLAVTCPRTSPIRIYAPNGHTYIEGFGEPVHVEQGEGTITVQHAKGPLDLTNRRGDVKVIECAGPATMSAERGTVMSRLIYGKQVIQCTEGKTVIDEPRGELVVRQRGGDVRIIQLDGVMGSYDVRVEGGDVSVLIPESADATIVALARNGRIYTAIPLTGEIAKTYQKFQGRPNPDAEGRYTVALETTNGDIVIDKGS